MITLKTVQLSLPGGIVTCELDLKKMSNWDFPRSAVVKNPPANAGNMGSIPGPGRSHMLWSN